jgi:hypothetical protein
LLLAEARAVEITFDDECDDVDDELVLVEDRVDDDWDHGGEEVAPEDLDDYNHKATGLEDGTVKIELVMV